MSRAEELSQNRYPTVAEKYAFIDGYEQAEKDLELTWEDIKEICEIAFVEACRLERNMKGFLIYKEQHYQEVLKQFKAQKGEKV